ncbi:MAG TPA: dihydrofolate reductase family protein [Terriglobales bacterium]|nr:dihydrofolate reductase family protein [Terriglobales bacterium]
MKASAFVGVSVDGFLARPDDGLDFLETGEQEPHGFNEFFRSVDALLIGRRTYEVVLGFGGWFYGKKRVYVLSSKPLKPAPKKAVVERLSGDPHQVVAQLEARGAKHVYVDGGQVIQSFLRAGLIDRLILTRVPVLIGQGIPLFGPLSHDIRLRAVKTRQYKGGLVQTEYEVLPRSARPARKPRRR